MPRSDDHAACIPTGAPPIAGSSPLAISSQSRTPPQGGGLASSHKPVRASRLLAPGLSSCETLLMQPDNNQAAARMPIINFIG
jgi:hypothetical protein